MDSQTEQQLLREYAEHGSEAAFAALVRRHLDLVYSAAVRMVCDPHLAEDVSQGAFLALAQNAPRLTGCPTVAGWLHRTAQNLAAKVVRTDVRRRAREQEAAAMTQSLSSEPDVPWAEVAPHLDTALRGLNEADRDVLLLRYFERKSAHEMAQALGISDEAAQKRVNRAVERLRQFFVRRGVLVGGSSLVLLISAHAVQAAPAGLAVKISTAVLTGTTLATTTTVAAATKVIAMTALQKTLVGAALVAAVGTGLYQTRQNTELRSQVQALQQQQASLTQEVQDLKQAQAKSQRLVAAAPAQTRAAVRANRAPAKPAEQVSSPTLEQDIERAHAESSPGRREGALQELSKSISLVDIPRALAFMAQKPGTDGVQSPLFKELAGKWGEKDTNTAAAWANSLSDTAARKTAIADVLYGWTHVAPEAAANFASALPAGEVQDAAVMMVVKEWSFRDARGAANWVSRFPEGKLRDDAIGPVIFWGQGACPAAIADMLDAFGKPELIQQHGEMLASIWLNRDEPAARAWIQKSPLADDVKERLLKQKN